MTILTSVPFRSADIFVLDSWPFVERLLRSASLPRMDELIEQAAKAKATLLLSEMNLGEIFYLVAKHSGEMEAESVLRTMQRLPISIVSISAGEVLRAARLKARSTLSYADCFCAALAIEHKAVVLTGDPDFLPLERAGLLRMEWIGR